VDAQVFQLLVIWGSISIVAPWIVIFGLLALFAWSVGLLGGAGGGRPVPTPVPVPTPPPGPVDPPAPAPQPALRSAKGSWYSQYQGKYSWVDKGDAPGSNALGVPDSDQGISFLNRSTLGQWFEVHAPNGVVSIEQQTDIGPAASTGRGIDISAAAAERFGYSPKTFPTDGIFQWRPISAPASVANLSPVAQAIAYQKTRTAAPTPPVVIGADPPWLTEARKYLGQTWSSGDPPQFMVNLIHGIMANAANRDAPGFQAYCTALLSGYRPWCGMFAAGVLAAAGKPVPFVQGDDLRSFAWAPGWDGYGVAVTGDPQAGDLMRFGWHGGGEHITFYEGRYESDDYYHCLGGNQSNAVTIAKFIIDDTLKAVRRPA